ncbi:hypothetical protein LIPSTDRAFT_5671 [Lipomyces starkeyi NRRL Y-11557]|uniref:Cytochrome c oxidase subunit 8, mitochondrial n=1 Tax=Lipomyces starkeyi NRRL Y-11557 TaxID=675824 RepID=A0A1E3PZQ4_LIPST|nr:hypothetical protein LIPSTDRAFT_5671 [Lipomyces starkeyi NRRL Y-11557]
MYAPIIARTALRATIRRGANFEATSRRGFSSSQIVRSGDHGHHPEGPYHNLPFKVHNRKIPFVIPFSIFFLVPFLTPFGMAALAM